MSPEFRVYVSPDIQGIEIGGALKNVVALAAGIADGLGYGCLLYTSRNGDICSLKDKNPHHIPDSSDPACGESALLYHFCGILPVSYTHLDVYKRQLFCSVNTPMSR